MVPVSQGRMDERIAQQVSENSQIESGTDMIAAWHLHFPRTMIDPDAPILRRASHW